MITTASTFAAALTDMGHAKELLHLVLSPHLRDESKKAAMIQVLKRAPGVTRFPETRAAYWLLS